MVKIGIQAGPEMGDHACLSPSFLRMHSCCLYLEVGGRIREVLVLCALCSVLRVAEKVQQKTQLTVNYRKRRKTKCRVRAKI